MTKTLESKITCAELRAFYPALAAVAEAGLKNPLDPDQAAWLDGPAFARWLGQNGLKPTNRLGDTVARSVSRWRDGDAVNLGTADSILTQLGHNLNDLPDRLWRNRPRRGGKVASGETRQRVAKERRDGATVRQLADRYNVAPGTVRRWVAEYAGRAA